MNDQLKPEAQAVAELVEKYHKPEVILLQHPSETDLRAPVLARPTKEGIVIESVKAKLDEYRTAPERRAGTASLTDLKSFIAHVIRFKDADSVIFADASPTKPALTAVLDYHKSGSDGAPRFGKHRAHYPFPLSEEWKAWQAMNGETMDAVTFAEFIEKRLADVADPTSAKDGALQFVSLLGCTYGAASRLLELSRGLSVRVNQTLKQAQNLSSGEMQFTFNTQHQDDDGTPLKVPAAFLLAIPVFDSGDVFQLPCRLRYRHREGKLTWSYDIHRDEETFRLAFDEACIEAHEQTALPLYRGSPEV